MMTNFIKKADKLFLNGSGNAALLAIQMAIILPIKLIKWGVVEVYKIQLKKHIDWGYRRKIFSESPLLSGMAKNGGVVATYIAQMFYFAINIAFFVMYIKFKKIGFLALALIFSISLFVPFGVMPSWLRFMIRYKAYLSFKEFIGVIKRKITHIL